MRTSAESTSHPRASLRVNPCPTSLQSTFHRQDLSSASLFQNAKQPGLLIDQLLVQIVRRSIPEIDSLNEGKDSEQRGTDQRWILHLLFGGNLLSSLEIAFSTLFRLSFLCSISNFCDTVPLHTILCEFRSTNVNIKFPSGT